VALAQVARAAAEVLGRHQLFEQVVRQRLARLVVLAHAQGLTLAHFSAQPELLLTQNTP